MKKRRIRVAIVGIGNCASSLVQGVSYYSVGSGKRSNIGLMHPNFGGYSVGDIEFVAAFDIDKRKVGADLSKAIFSQPNCAKRVSEVKTLRVLVQRGPILDGVASHMKKTFLVDSQASECDVASVLRDAKADMLICYLPVGSARAARFYADQALRAGAGFINAIPEFICSDKTWINKFKKRGLPCAGDDIKSQVGATILHRALARLVYDRGQSIDSMYQLNIGGNSDFLNMRDENRLSSKRKSKTQAVTSILNDLEINLKIGPSDYIPHLGDTKVCYIQIQGKQFCDVPFEIDLKLSVEDSPNSAGVMVDVIRAMKIALDRGVSGNLEEISSYAFKSPAVQYTDDIARLKVEEFILGKK